MLTLIQVPFRFGFLGWVSVVPFILVCRPETRAWRLVWISWVVSFIYWLVNLWWIGLVTIPAYILFSASQGLYWPILAVCIRFVKKKFPAALIVAIPILFVGAEAWQGVIYTGFNWRLLGHSQWSYLPVIQIADIFGVSGISFIIALVNGLVVELIIASHKRQSWKAANIAKASVVGCIIAVVVVYGQQRLEQTKSHTTKGPVVGSVQPNIPSEVKEISENADLILENLLRDSNACFEAGAKFIAWPETIVLETLNPSYVNLCREGTQPKVYNQILSDHAKDRGYVLLGAHAATVISLDAGIGDRFNSAFLYTPEGKQDLKRYDKMHLVPFGEYIPFKESAPFIYKMILGLSPYDYDYNLTKGKEFTTFDVLADNKEYGFGVLICYEDTDPKVTRQMVVSPDGTKKADWLANISNDGWYVRYKNEKVLPSVELAQRTVITVFRAVENRVSILRSVNTGISCIIDSTGRIRDGFANGNLPESAMDRQGVEGWFTDSIDIDDRVTFFSRNGQWLEIVCGAALVVILTAALWKTKKTKLTLEVSDK